jgi:hypothetical protein
MGKMLSLERTQQTESMVQDQQENRNNERNKQGVAGPLV